MDLKQQYREETNKEIYILDIHNGDYNNTEYVKWLEAKINLTGCSLELKDVKKLTLLDYSRMFYRRDKGDTYKNRKTGKTVSGDDVLKKYNTYKLSL